MTDDRTTPRLIAIFVVLGFFIVLTLLLTGKIRPPDTQAVGLTLGIAASAFLAIVFFWFGSSVGSRAKDDILAGQVQQTPPPSSPGAPGEAKEPPAIPPAPTPQKPPSGPPAQTLTGKVSWFGGPNDHGVREDEGLALCEPGEVGKFPGLFLAAQPAGTTGLARRLNPQTLYIACRWDYKRTPRAWLQSNKVAVTANGKTLQAQPIDWGPNADTGRIADLSKGLLDALGLKTDDAVTVTIPLPGTAKPTQNIPGIITDGAEPPWLTLARAEIGFHELPDNHGIQRYVDLAGYGADGEPWCSIFAGAMLKKAGIDITGVNAMAQSWTTAKSVEKIDTPRPGALAVFWRGTRSSGQGHVGFYVGEDDRHVQTLGGNEDDAVEIAPMAKNASTFGLLGYWWPRSTAAATDAKVT